MSKDTNSKENILLKLEELLENQKQQNELLLKQNRELEILKQEIFGVRNKLWSNDWEPKQNIRKHLFFLAGQETAAYIEKNMLKVKTFAHSPEILPYALSQVKNDGLYLEFGVYSGITINCIAKEKQNSIIYGFDSFSGLPEDWRIGFEKGTFARKDIPEVESNVSLIKGWFQETLPEFVKVHQEKCAFIHIDCDLYSSTKCVLDILKKRIVKDTILVFDEYFNYPGWKEGEFLAFQEFISENHLEYEYLAYVDALEQVAVRIK